MRAAEASSSRGPYRAPTGLLGHRFLYGDWHPWLRDPIDLLRITFVLGTVAFAVLGNLEAAFRLGATAVFVYVARALNVPRLFDLGFVIGMSLQGWGNVFDLFNKISFYDVIVHFTLSLWVAPLFYIGLARLRVVPDLAEANREHHLGIFVVTLAVGLAFGACYEIYEWVIDNWFGGNLAIGETDTIGDLTMDLLGSAIGGALLTVWASRGWSTMRRVPASRIVVR